MKLEVKYPEWKEGKKDHYNVTIKGECFKNVPGLAKCNECEYYEDCEATPVVRTFDCPRNAENVKTIYIGMTSLIMVIIATIIWSCCKMGVLIKLAILIVVGVIFNAICNIVEEVVGEIRDNLFYEKLKSEQQKAEEQIRQQEEAEEAKKQAEEMQANQQDPYRLRIIQAESMLNELTELALSVDFGRSETKVDFCVSKLSEIVEHLKIDSSRYGRVSSLMELYLPEFYSLLEIYANFKTADAVTEEHEEILENCVDNFYNFLQEKKVDAILDKQYEEMALKATARTLESLMNGGKLES